MAAVDVQKQKILQRMTLMTQLVLGTVVPEKCVFD